MAPTIVKGSDPIKIDHPVMLWVGQPGICKTSLSFSAKNCINFDFDAGAHRAVNRRDTLVIKSWADVEDPIAIIKPYDTVIVDTVGRCLDRLADAILDENPKNGHHGSLTQSGWGILKTRYRLWLQKLRDAGKDVLLIAHAKEDRDGDTVKIRADIQGGSYAEVMKNADLIGYLFMDGKRRILDFSPTESWVGKNPGGWPPLEIPPAEKAGTFAAELFDLGRLALGRISEADAATVKQVDGWRIVIDALENADGCTSAVKEINKLPTMVKEPVKKLLHAKTKALGLTWNKKDEKFKKVAA